MKRILTINCTSDNGSIPKIIGDIEKDNPEYEFFHCYQIGKKTYDRHEYLVASWNMTRFYYGLARIVGIKYGIGNRPTERLIEHIKKVNPDLIHIHCPNFYSINLYRLIAWLKGKSIPVVITNHAEFFYTGNCAYALECLKFKTGCNKCDRQFDAVHPYLTNKTHFEWMKMKDAFKDAYNFTMVVVSPWQEERIRQSPIIPKHMQIRTILNGVNTEVFRLYNDEEKIELRRKLGIKEKGHIALHVTSFFTDDEKNLKGGDI